MSRSLRLVHLVRTAAVLAIIPALLGAIPAPQGNDLLEALTGKWKGTCKTWSAGRLIDESPVTGEFLSTFGGRLVRHAYSGKIRGKPRSGEESICFDTVEKRYQTAWFDTFHMNHAMMFSVGTAKAEGRGFAVLGSYRMTPGQKPWGWRTEYALGVGGGLTITAFNIAPDGREEKAVETVYERAGADQPAARTDPLAVVKAFVEALDAMQPEALEATVAADVTMFFPHGDSDDRFTGEAALDEMRRRFDQWRAAGGRAPLGVAKAATDFAVQQLGPRGALISWRVARATSPGRRTAVVRLGPDGWRIVHFHSSNAR